MSKDKLYWSIIEDMNWLEYSQKHHGYSDMKVNFMRSYGADMAVKVRDFVSKKQGDLMRMLDNLPDMNEVTGFCGGDDSFGDMTAHVVGLGEEYYNAVMEKPKLLKKLDYVECFTYALPYGEDDYKVLDNQYHVEFAMESMKQLVENIEEAVEKNGGEPQDYINAADVLRRLALVVAGDYAHAVEDLKWDRDYRKICDISIGAANGLFEYKRYGKQTYLG